MKADIHPKYLDAEIRCACGNVIKTRSTRPSIMVGICNVCHPFYTGTQKFVDTAGRVDKFQQRMAKTQAAQAAAASPQEKEEVALSHSSARSVYALCGRFLFVARSSWICDRTSRRFIKRFAEIEAALERSRRPSTTSSAPRNCPANTLGLRSSSATAQPI